jgi:hypothetical protein
MGHIRDQMITALPLTNPPSAVIRKRGGKRINNSWLKRKKWYYPVRPKWIMLSREKAA